MSRGVIGATPPPDPRRPWVLRMRWSDLLFAHWPMPPTVLMARLPSGLELDTFDGVAWLGIVPFRMEDVAPRGWPAIPGLSVFPELNVRTYVRHRGVPGVWFLSLDAASRVTVEGARRKFHLPYVHARMSARTGEDGTVTYDAVREDQDHPPAVARARYRPTGPVEAVADGSLEAWLTARWRLFSADADGGIHRAEIRHAPWPLQSAEAPLLDVGRLAAAHGLTLPDVAPHLRFAERVDVRGWWPVGA